STDQNADELGLSTGGSIGYRLNYYTRIGIGFRWRDVTRDIDGDYHRRTNGLNMNLSRQHSDRLSQQVAIRSERRSENQQGREADTQLDNEIEWRLAWDPQSPIYSDFSLGYQWTDQSAQRTEGPLVNVSLGWVLSDALSMSLGAGYGQTDSIGDRGNDYQSRNWAWRSALNWQINEAWALTASAGQQLNTTDASSFNPALDTRDEQSVERGSNEWVIRLNYQRSGGQEQPALGYQGSQGSGRLIGYLYQDHNKDQVRQPTEPGLAGVNLLLDNRYPLQTDSDGRFELSNVATGTHQLIVDDRSLPLPWEMGNNRRKTFRINLRDTTTVQLGAVAIDY
ncbi:transporter, partial [Gammaproteobacteria bacterium]|nr:transporter [Gammaproteobacteria bacterium]